MIAVLGTLFQVEEMNIKDVLIKRMQKIDMKQTEKEMQERIKKICQNTKTSVSEFSLRSI